MSLLLSELRISEIKLIFRLSSRTKSKTKTEKKDLYLNDIKCIYEKLIH